MAGDQRALEILIRAKDQASAEMNKIAASAKKLGEDTKKSLGQGLLGSLKDSAAELKSFIRGFSLIQAGRFLFGLIEDWQKVKEETRAAREEFSPYVSLRNAPSRLKEELKATRDALLGITDEQNATALAILADRFKIAGLEAKQLAEDAAFLSGKDGAFKDDPVAAFDALAKARAGFSDTLLQKLGLEKGQEEILLNIRKERLATEKEIQATALERSAQNVESGFGGLSGGQNRLRAEAAELREQAAATRAAMKELQGLDPLAAERAKAEAEVTRQLKEQNRALQVQKPLVQEIVVDRSDFAAGLREGFEEFKQGITNFREQGRQTVLSLLGGVSQLGLASVDTLVTRTASARDALKQFVTDMLRLLAQLAAQLAASRLLGLLFNAVGGAAAPNGFQQGLQNAGVNGGIGQPLAMGAGIGTGPNGGGAGGGTTNIIFNVVDMAGADEFLVRHRNTIIQIVAGAAGSNRDFRVAMQVR